MYGSVPKQPGQHMSHRLENKLLAASSFHHLCFPQTQLPLGTVTMSWNMVTNCHTSPRSPRLGSRLSWQSPTQFGNLNPHNLAISMSVCVPAEKIPLSTCPQKRESKKDKRSWSCLSSCQAVMNQLPQACSLVHTVCCYGTWTRPRCVTVMEPHTGHSSRRRRLFLFSSKTRQILNPAVMGCFQTSMDP